MRLIDSDKLENDIVENITVKAVSRMLAITQGQPTVKAIPVEWIDKYENTEWEGDELVFTKMIRKWEKEHEISIMPVSDNSTIPLDYLGERK